uniref:Band 7 domain-containing protein n=1 Tax=Ditylenchus dipsaci TaxID=166011 RepID=A0A915D088_9BILA
MLRKVLSRFDHSLDGYSPDPSTAVAAATLNYSDLKNDGKRPFSIAYFAVLMLAYILFLLTLPVSLLFCIKVVHEYKRMVVFRLGRLKPEMGPGVVMVLPCIDLYHMIDLRTRSYDVPSQEMLTKDSVTVCVDAAVYFRVSDPIATVFCILDAHLSTKQLAQTTLRNCLGTRTLTEIMMDREGIAMEAQAILDEGTDPWGIKVERVEVKDIRLPRELTRVLAAEAEASREADARVSLTWSEKASVALKRAAENFAGSSAAVNLRYLQTLCRIAAYKNHTIVLPIPVELVKGFMRRFCSNKKLVKK